MNVNIHNRLIKKGYISEEIRQWYSSKILASRLDTIHGAIDFTKVKTSKPVNISIPKGRFHRRIISIPNPYNYIQLSSTIHNNWTEIETHFNKSTLSLTKPEFINGVERSVSKKYSFEDISRIFNSSSVGKNYVLKTDISRFYSSIYTHSIPWAMHGKSFAKQKRNRGDNYLGNLLDKQMRNSQDAQTAGIQVGNDVSLIVSELIGCAIDELVLNEFNSVVGFRYIDDYYLFFRKKEEAETVLASLRRTIGQFELELNNEKTTIYGLPRSTEPEWTSKLNSIQLNNDNLLSYVNTVYDLFSKYPDDEVMRYAIARINNIKVIKKNWKTYQAFLLNAMTFDPLSMPIATDTFFNYFLKSYGVDKSMIENAIENIVEKAVNSEHHYEIIWSLWLLKLLRMKHSDNLKQLVCSVDNPIIALIMLSENSRKKIDTSKWQIHMNFNELYDSNWILAYEALYRGWLPSNNSKNYIDSDPFFSCLKKRNVSFFNTNARDEWAMQNFDHRLLNLHFSGAF
ncbi:RNA-directed DNA polymerase [Lutibacter sp. B2]|nr:RNA-directed DNA polymerase [Lutibacter sp. B2]